MILRSKLTFLRFLGPLAITFAAGCSAPTATRTSTGQVGGGRLTAVYSRASEGYVRAQNPDGSFQPESYIFKEGGNFGGPRVDHKTALELGFDAGFGPGTKPSDVANFIYYRLLERTGRAATAADMVTP